MKELTKEEIKEQKELEREKKRHEKEEQKKLEKLRRKEEKKAEKERIKKVNYKNKISHINIVRSNIILGKKKYQRGMVRSPYKNALLNL